MDCSLPGSSVHGILQARILEWVAISSPGDLLNPRIKPIPPPLADGFFTTKAPGKLSLTFRERLICGGQMRKYLLDLGNPNSEKLKAGFEKHRGMLLNQKAYQ